MQNTADLYFFMLLHIVGFAIEKNLTTIKETEYVDLSSFFAEDSNATSESTVDIVFVSGDTDKKMTKKEMFISEKLMKFKEIYAQYGGIYMLDEKMIEIINDLLAEGFDIEIQHRKNSIVIVTEYKNFICSVK